MRSHQDILESRMQGKLARPVWGWGPGEIPGPTPLFVGSPAAGQRAATLMSLIASCKANHVEPWAYLKDVFTRLPSHQSPTDLAEMLPDQWLIENPQHRWNIADRRREERKAKEPST